MTEAQREALTRLCERYKVPFDESHYTPAFDLPPDWVNGWIGGQPGTIFVGCDPDGSCSS